MLQIPWKHVSAPPSKQHGRWISLVVSHKISNEVETLPRGPPYTFVHHLF